MELHPGTALAEGVGGDQARLRGHRQPQSSARGVRVVGTMAANPPAARQLADGVEELDVWLRTLPLAETARDTT